MGLLPDSSSQHLEVVQDSEHQNGGADRLPRSSAGSSNDVLEQKNAHQNPTKQHAPRGSQHRPYLWAHSGLDRASTAHTRAQSHRSIGEQARSHRPPQSLPPLEARAFPTALVQRRSGPLDGARALRHPFAQRPSAQLGTEVRGLGQLQFHLARFVGLAGKPTHGNSSHHS